MATIDLAPTPSSQPEECPREPVLDIQVQPGGLIVAGEIDVANRATFHTALLHALGTGYGAVVLDFGRVTHADAGTATLLLNAARVHRRQLVLVDAPHLLAWLTEKLSPTDRRAGAVPAGRVTFEITSAGGPRAAPELSRIAA